MLITINIIIRLTVQLLTGAWTSQMASQGIDHFYNKKENIHLVHVNVNFMFTYALGESLKIN